MIFLPSPERLPLRATVELTGTLSCEPTPTSLKKKRSLLDWSTSASWKKTRWIGYGALLCSLAAGAEARTYVVSPQGDDQGPGTRTQPLQTISAAAAKAMPGDTVLVLEGTYRERVDPPRGGEAGKRITYRGEPGKRVFIKGSALWQPEWRDEGDGLFSAQPADKLFDDHSPDYVDHHNPFRVQLASTPWERDGRQEVNRGFGGDPEMFYSCGQVFVSGKPYREVPYQRELAAGHWFFDGQSGRIYVHFGQLKPGEQQVEISTRRRIFAPSKRGLGYITVEGFVMEHCGNQYPTNFWVENRWAQKGALGLGAGHHWIVRKNIIRYCKTFAIDAGYVDRRSPSQYRVNDNLIEQNYILENGSAGILSNRSENLVIRDNVIAFNNTLRFFEIKRWEQAGIKCHGFKNGHIHHNYVANNYLTYGVWLDNQFPDSRVSHNVIVNNERAGIFLEMSDYDYDRLLVDHNVVVGNHENAVYIHDASGATFAHNLFACTPAANSLGHRDSGQAVYIRQASARTKTYHHSFFNNLFINNHQLVDVDYPSHRGGPQRFEHNVYDSEPDARRFAINKLSEKPSPWEDQEFMEKISTELGAESPGAEQLTGRRRARLAFSEWQVFWRYHGLANDIASQLQVGSQATYDAKQQRLMLDISYQPAGGGSTDVAGLDTDFFGRPLPKKQNAKAGPFQALQTGKNMFEVWSGLLILQPGQLPSQGFNR